MIIRMLAVSSLVAVMSYAVVISMLPQLIMTKLTERVQELSDTEGFAISPRVTPESQRVVRSSPDMLYALCVMDLTQGDWEVVTHPWPGYGSVSIFAANTDNIETRSLGPGVEAAVTITIGGPDADLSPPGSQAMVLVRRLAPTAELYATARDVASQDACRPRNQG